MNNWKLTFDHEESPAAEKLISIFIEVEFEKNKMKDILNIDGLFSAVQKQGFQPLFTCSCGTFGCGGYYINVSHSDNEIVFRNIYKPVEEPNEAYLIEAFECALSWEDLYFIVSEVYEKLVWISGQYQNYDVCSGTYGPGLMNRLSSYGELVREVRSRYED